MNKPAYDPSTMKAIALLTPFALVSCATAPKAAGVPKPQNALVQFLTQFKVEIIAGFNGISAGVRIEPAPEKPVEVQK